MKKSTITILIAYRIVAKRKEFEMERLELAPWVSEEEPFLVVPTPPAPPIDRYLSQKWKIHKANHLGLG